MTTPARAAASATERICSRRLPPISSTTKPSEMKKRTFRPGSGEEARTTERSEASVLTETPADCCRIVRARVSTNCSAISRRMTGLSRSSASTKKSSTELSPRSMASACTSVIEGLCPSRIV